MSLPKSASYRLFSFHFDGKFAALRLEFEPGLSEKENAENLYQRFHACMEKRFPGCFLNGRITHLGYVDGTINDINGHEAAGDDDSFS